MAETLIYMYHVVVFRREEQHVSATRIQRIRRGQIDRRRFEARRERAEGAARAAREVRTDHKTTLGLPLYFCLAVTIYRQVMMMSTSQARHHRLTALHRVSSRRSGTGSWLRRRRRWRGSWRT